MKTKNRQEVIPLKKSKEEKEQYFHSYFSTEFLRAGAILLCVLFAIIALLLILLLKTNIFLSIVIILATIILGLSFTAGTFVLTNMSDDLKYLSESMEQTQGEVLNISNNIVTSGQLQIEYQQRVLVFMETIEKNHLKEKDQANT